MRHALETLYALSRGLAALFLALILLTVLAQVGLNVLDAVFEFFTGDAIGLLIPSYADFAGYFLATATFFALAGSFRSGAHIRVTLFLVRLSEGPRRACEIFSAAIAFAFVSFFLVFAASLTAESWRFGDLSPGLVPIPIWIPQLAMTIGLAALGVATADSLVTFLRGGKAPYAEAEAEFRQLMEE
ncbi:MAG TPA: TRAP transporter small permease [Hyphomicrobiales bacterium]|nr:TRAP transporter small permease [Hyphomicrobiales bacterium]